MRNREWYANNAKDAFRIVRIRFRMIRICL
jgi:hypothetical protein